MTVLYYIMCIEDYIIKFNAKFSNYHSSQLDKDDYAAVWEGVFKGIRESQFLDLLATAKRKNNTLIVNTVAKRVAEIIESDATPEQLRKRFDLVNDI